MNMGKMLVCVCGRVREFPAVVEVLQRVRGRDLLPGAPRPGLCLGEDGALCTSHSYSIWTGKALGYVPVACIAAVLLLLVLLLPAILLFLVLLFSYFRFLCPLSFYILFPVLLVHVLLILVLLIPVPYSPVPCPLFLLFPIFLFPVPRFPAPSTPDPVLLFLVLLMRCSLSCPLVLSSCFRSSWSFPAVPCPSGFVLLFIVLLMLFHSSLNRAKPG